MDMPLAEITHSRVELVPIILIDEVNGNSEDYNKETVQYINKNYERVKGLVKKQSKDMSVYEVEEVLSDVIVYFAKANDYSLSRACKSDGSDILDIEAYISKIIKYSICRRKHNKYARSQFEISILNSKERQDSDGREFIESFSSMDGNVALDETLIGNIDNALEDAMYIRNKFNDIDIFELIYIRLKIGNHDKCDCMMQILGHNKKDLMEAEKRMRRVEEVKDLLTVITRTDKELVISKVGSYLYCKKSIDEAISHMCGQD